MSQQAPQPKPARGPLAWLLRTMGYAGICLPPLGIYILPLYLTSARLVRHEQAHWHQYLRAGSAPRFYARWLWLTLRHGYARNPMEIEARAAADAPPPAPPRNTA